MKAFFDRDGRKSNTIDVPEEGQCKKTGLDICSNMWTAETCNECHTSRRSVEYRTVQLMIPIHEQDVDTGSYPRWSEWDATPKDMIRQSVDGTVDYAVPKAFIEQLRTILTMQLDLLKSCEKKEEK